MTVKNMASKGLDELQKALDKFPEKEFHYDPSVVNSWLKDFRKKFAVFRQSLAMPVDLQKQAFLRVKKRWENRIK
jgi:hypothetical protein